MILLPSGAHHLNKAGISGAVLAGLTPICKKRIPFLARIGISERVCPGTSVIFAEIVFLPNRLSKFLDIWMPKSYKDESDNSV